MVFVRSVINKALVCEVMHPNGVVVQTRNVKRWPRSSGMFRECENAGQQPPRYDVEGNVQVRLRKESEARTENLQRHLFLQEDFEPLFNQGFKRIALTMLIEPKSHDVF